MRLTILALLAATTLPLAVQAQQLSPMTGTTATAPVASPTPVTPAPARARRTRMTMQQRFDAANTTKDGKLTLDQAQAANMTRVATNFTAIDTGKKGYVTVEDIRAYNRAQRMARKAAAKQ